MRRLIGWFLLILSVSNYMWGWTYLIEGRYILTLVYATVFFAGWLTSLSLLNRRVRW